MYEFVISLLIVMILLKRFTNRVKRTNLQIPLPVTDSNQNIVVSMQAQWYIRYIIRMRMMSQQQHKRYFTERISKFQFLPRIQQRTLTKAMKQKQDILTISSSI